LDGWCWNIATTTAAGCVEGAVPLTTIEFVGMAVTAQRHPDKQAGDVHRSACDLQVP